MTREEQVMYADMLLHSGALSEDAIKAIKADFPELAESEDERVRNWIISVVMTDKKLTAEQKERMKAYLEKQKEQPAEWSEEDEKIMQTMIKEGDLKPSEIAWLKSLRPQPHWKPSEEQMDVFVDALYYLPKNGFKDPNGCIESLYNDLKKLM